MYKIIEKYWGTESWIQVTPDYTFKKLEISKGKTLLNHYHEMKEETFYVTKGTGVVIINGKSQFVSPGSIIHITPYTRHQVYAERDLVILEASTTFLEDRIREEL